jgi:hypothetical protein
MASINKSDYWKDRRGTHGKGDLKQGSFVAYRDALFWKRSVCCNVHIKQDSEGRYICNDCNKFCHIK